MTDLTFDQPALRRTPWLIEARALLVLAAPMALAQLAQMAVMTTDVILLGRLSREALAAAAIGNTVYYFAWLIGSGPGMAVSPVIAQILGARRAGITAMVLATGFISLVAVAMVLFGQQIAGLYLGGGRAGDAAVIVLAAQFLLVAAAFQVFDALQVVGAHALRGLKDARMPMVLAGVSYWLAGAPVCILLGVVLKMQGLGVWIGLAFGLAVAAAAMCWRFHRITRA